MKSDKLFVLNKSEKILLAIYELNKSGKDKITVEDVAIKIWQMWPSEFCMRGYPQYPNVDIQKYITKLLNNNLINGGVYDYKITDKGRDYYDKIKNQKNQKNQKKGEVTAEQPRHIKTEMFRIINSNVFKYFIKNKPMQFLESDFFEFLGTSARSLNVKDKNIFLIRYNTIIKDIIPYCVNIKDKDEYADKIIKLWDLLSKKFEYVIKKKWGKSERT